MSVADKHWEDCGSDPGLGGGGEDRGDSRHRTPVGAARLVGGRSWPHESHVTKLVLSTCPTLSTTPSWASLSLSRLPYLT